MKQFKRGLAFLLAMVLVLSTTSVGVQAATTKKGTVKAVTITNPSTKTLVMKKGKTFKLKTSVEVTGKKVSKAVTYTTSNKKVATVTSKGKIKALKNGKATITVKSKANAKKKAILKVIVKTPVAKVTLDKSEISLTEGETAEVKATVTPETATKKDIVFESDDETIAKVDAKGIITAVKEGKTTITATAQDGNDKKATCVVTVTKKAEAPAKTAEPTKAPTATPDVKPSAAPTAAPTEKPDPDPYDPNKKLDLVLDDTDEEDEAYSIPSISANTPADEQEYTLKWADNFDGDELNRDDWNVETHDPAWVNEELQAYVDSEKNIYVEDGNLVLRPIRTKSADGKEVITSGRVNTQGKHDFTYGLFEVRAKVPTGKGFLPAFWMMPTNENLYGQWPRCGEIDAMEVMGQETNKLYGTIHYGNPHSEKQGTYTLEDGSFADDYHTFACDWQPGKITWYVDGIKYHEADDWYSTTVGQGTVAYPAPFDQPFYAILNLAVGGKWVGYPDADTTINNEAFIIDYVKIFQKDEYDENVQPPEKKPVVFKDADENGNFITNGDFSEDEALDGEDGKWQFMTALGGEAKAEIKDGAIVITTTKEGTVDYSVQLVQPKIPAKQGYTYEVSFDAKAAENRKIGVAVKAPDRSYIAYAEKNFDITTEKQTFTLDYKMDDESDANSRLEFNMGAKGSTATLYISNVSIKVKKEPTKEELDAYAAKKVLTDGNSIYNGKFQEGADRLAYWDITKAEGTSVSVTNLADDRRLKVEANEGQPEDVVIGQTALPMLADTDYVLSFDVQASKATKISYTIGGVTKEVNVTTENQKIRQKFSKKAVAAFTNKDFSMNLGNVDVIYIDNVRFEEDALILNGKFNAGMSGYEVFVESPAEATYVVDSQKEDNAIDFDIKNTANAEYQIQLKQNNVTLEEDQWYTVSFDARSSIARSIQYAIQRDGNVHSKVNEKGETVQDWTPYVQETVDLEASTTDYTRISKTFQMQKATDAGSIFNIALGGGKITEQHRVCIDNISLVKTVAPLQPQPIGDELLTNGDFADGKKGWTEQAGEEATATWSFDEENAKVDISSLGNATPGSHSWHVNLKQTGLTLKKGCEYKLTATITSNVDRVVEFACMDSASSNGHWYVTDESNKIALKANEPNTVTFTISVGDNKTDTDAYIGFNLGKVDATTPDASIITIDDVSLVRTSGEEVDEPVVPEEPDDEDDEFEEVDVPEIPADEDLYTNNMFKAAAWAATMETTGATSEAVEGGFTYTVPGLTDASDEWRTRITQEGIKLEKGANYKLTFDIGATLDRTIKYGFQNASYAYYAGENTTLKAGEVKHIAYDFSVSGDTDENIMFYLNFGRIDIYGASGLENSIIPKGKTTYTVKNLKLVKVVEEGSEPTQAPTATPTVAPTATPTATPTAEPTAKPTAAPTPVVTPSPAPNMIDVSSMNQADIVGAGYATVNTENGEVTFTLTEKTVSNDYDVQWAQYGIQLEEGKMYEYGVTVKGSENAVDSPISIGVQRNDPAINDYSPFGTPNDVHVSKDYVTHTGTFTVGDAYDHATFRITMGILGSENAGKQLTFKDVYVREIEENIGEDLLPNLEKANEWNGWEIYYADVANKGEGTGITDDGAKLVLNSVDNNNYLIQLKGSASSLEAGKTYRVKAKVNSTVGRKITIGFADEYTWKTGVGVDIPAGDKYINIDITMPESAGTIAKPVLQINVGKDSAESADITAHTIMFSEVHLYEVVED